MTKNKWQLISTPLIIVTLAIPVLAQHHLRNATDGREPMHIAHVGTFCEADIGCPTFAVCRNYTCRCNYGWTTTTETEECGYQQKSRSEAMARNSYFQGSYWGANEAYMKCDAAFWGRNLIIWGGLIIAPSIAVRASGGPKATLTGFQTKPFSSPDNMRAILIASGVTAISALVNGLWSVIQDYNYQSSDFLDCNGVPTVE